MKVLLVHNAYRDRGGEERHLDLLEQGLQAVGVSTRRFVVDSRELAEYGVGARARTAGLMAFNPRAARAIQPTLEEWRPDIVHAHNLFPVLTPSVLRATRRMGVATILTAHNYRLFCPAGTLTRRGVVHSDCIRGSSFLCGVRGARPTLPESLAYGVAVALQRRLKLSLRWTNAIVTPSRALRETLISAGFPSTALHHIANGVPVHEFVARPREHVLFAGRLSREKGLETLVAAARLIPEIPMKIAGDGPLRGALGRTPPNVELLGWVDPERLQKLRSSSALEIVPSVSQDILPYAALESLAAGTPVLASRIGGLPEIAAGPAGETVPAGDAGALAASMRAWWARSSEPDYGRGAAEVARSRFSLDGQTRELVALYGRVS